MPYFPSTLMRSTPDAPPSNVDDIAALREYEGRTLRPKWDALRLAAERNSGMTNWNSVPAEFWPRADAEAYASLMVAWGVKCTRALEAADPQGTNLTDPALTSLRRTYLDFHVPRMLHLKGLGISVPAPPSEIVAAIGGAGKGLLDVAQGIGDTALNLGKTALKAADNLAGGATFIVIAAVIVGGLVLFTLYRKR